MTLLKQLQDEIPPIHSARVVWFSADVAEAERIAQAARELKLTSVKFLMTLNRFEPRPPDGHPKQAAFDVLVGALKDVVPRLAQLPPIERDGG